MNELSNGVRVLERYRILRPLGRGGMGVVYLGRTEGSAGFTRPVVIKQLHAALAVDRGVTEMFAREARILASLQHPNIVSVIDFGQDGHSYVMVLEYVHGYDLDQWSRLLACTRRPLSHEVASYIVRRVLTALEHAHQAAGPDGTPANIVHRDVSLSNVLLDANAQVKLHDFGIARMEGSAETVTQAGVFKGKLAFAAPELLRGAPATRRSDVYATAVMAYQLLAGHNPFKGQSEAETLFRVLEHLPPALSTLRNDLPGELDALLSRALHKDPDARFESAASLAEELAALSTRTDEAVIRDLARQLGEDFAAMPEHLGLEALTERDAAWREAQDVPPGSATSLAAPAVETTEMQARALAKSRVSVPPQVSVRRFSAPAASPPRAQAPWRTFAVALGAGVVALAILMLTVRRDAPAPSTPRYLVVEKPAAAASPAPSGPVPEPAPRRELAVAGPQRSAPARPNAAALSQQFKVHQPEVESCFRQHSAPSEEPRLSVRFELAPSGRVTRANLSPAALEADPLGRCLLGVASAARFSPLTEPVAFSIPILARRGAARGAGAP